MNPSSSSEQPRPPAQPAYPGQGSANQFAPMQPPPPTYPVGPGTPGPYPGHPYQHHQPGMVQYGAVNGYYQNQSQPYTEPASDVKMFRVNRNLFFWAWLPLATASLALWVLGLWFMWIGPLIVTIPTLVLGGVAVGSEKPKWGVVVAWIVVLFLYVFSTGWQVTYGVLSLTVEPHSPPGTCLPTYFSGDCRSSADCNDQSCYWGTCTSYTPPSSCYSNSDCWTSYGSYECYFSREETDTTWLASPAFGGVFLTVSVLFLIINFVQSITAMVWVCRTGRSPCCPAARYHEQRVPLQ